MTSRKTATLFICFLCLLCLAGCKPETDNTNNTDEQTTIKESETEMIRMNETNDGVVVDDLLECIDMLGKTATEIGIPREVINNEKEYYIRTYVDGKIFGTEDYGILHFDYVDDDKNNYLAKGIWIHVKKVGYDECKMRLSEKFGNPTDEGENPYVEIDGGAVTWADYRLPDIKLTLSSASQRDYVEINIEKLTD